MMPGVPQRAWWCRQVSGTSGCVPPPKGTTLCHALCQLERRHLPQRLREGRDSDRGVVPEFEVQLRAWTTNVPRTKVIIADFFRSGPTADPTRVYIRILRGSMDVPGGIEVAPPPQALQHDLEQLFGRRHLVVVEQVVPATGGTSDGLRDGGGAEGWRDGLRDGQADRHRNGERGAHKDNVEGGAGID